MILPHQDRFDKNMELLKKSGLKYKFLYNNCVRICNKIDFWPRTDCYMEVGKSYGFYDGFDGMVDELKRILNEKKVVSNG